MKPKIIAILTVLVALTAIFISFQNFTFEKQKTDKMDLSAMIVDSEDQRGEMQSEIHKQAPPKKLSAEGLTTSGQMKRVKIEGTEESIMVNDSNPIFQTPERDPANSFDKDLNKRFEQELNEESE